MKKDLDEFNEMNRNPNGVAFLNLSDLKNKDFTKSNNFLHKFYSNLELTEVKIINTLLYIFSSYSKMYKNDEIKTNYILNNFEQDGFFEIKYQDLLKLLNIDKTTTILEIEYMGIIDQSSSLFCAKIVYKSPTREFSNLLSF